MPSSKSAGGRWSLRRGSGSGSRDRADRNSSSYMPPSLDSSVSGASSEVSSTNVSSSNTGGGLTSGISTLFRRQQQQAPPKQKPVATATTMPRPNSRLFYSDDVSSDDDSYESRVSSASKKRRNEKDDDEEDEEEDPALVKQQLKRYRGFSTSLKSLFLDEALVCASMGCFGLLLSHRTEHLLSIKRGTAEGGGARHSSSASRHPSNIMAYALLLTMALIATTFIVWGFGNGMKNTYAEDYVEGYDYTDMTGGGGYYNNNNRGGDSSSGYIYNNGANNKNNGGDSSAGDSSASDGSDSTATDTSTSGGNRDLLLSSKTTTTTHGFHGICKLRDSQEHLWEPIMDFVRDEWYRDIVMHRDLDQSYTNGEYDVTDSAERFSKSKPEHNMGTNIRMGLLIAFLIVLGIVGRRRRMRTRYSIQRARAQEDQLYNASRIIRAQGGERENQYQGACSHTLFGCYPVDPPDDDSEQEDDELEVKETASGFSLFNNKKKKRLHEDCVSRAFSCLMATCCGVACRCWFQCLSICALAQEAREVRVLVPPRFQRIDFITLQPFSEYQKNVNDLRRGWLGKTRRKTGMMPHWQAISRLSRYILAVFLSTFLLIVLTLVLNPRAAFSWNDAIVLTATFVQSFLVLYVVFWIFHKSDLSLDAVIKFFAAGFLIATPAAFIFEGLLVNVILAFSYWIYMVAEMIRGEAFVDWIVAHYRLIWIFGELVNAYIVAAVTEELCKYYTFRTVEHPDLIFLTGLDRKSQDTSAVKGGLVQYPYGGHKVSELNRSNSFGSEYSHRSSSSKPRNKSKQHRGSQDDDFASAIHSAGTEEDEFFEDENDARTYRQKAMAITTGMISVAVGLACAENFLYVFILGGTGSSSDGSGILQEWIVLFFRSIFPIHALAAAMQSINMIRKFVECSDDNSHRVGVGRIVLPAVVLHGTFDAILLSINVYVETAWDKYREEHGGNVQEGVEPYNALLLNLVAWISIIIIMLIGMVWYYRQNRSQRLRLIVLEESEKTQGEEDDGDYQSPSPSKKSPKRKKHQVEMELV